MADLRAVVANVVLRFVFAHLFVEFFGPVEIHFHEDFGVVVGALGALFTVPVHIVPAQFTDDVFVFAHFAVEAESHIEVGATFIHVSVGTVLSFFASLFHEIGAYFKVVAEIAFIAVTATTHTLKFIAGFYFALVVGVGTVVG